MSAEGLLIANLTAQCKRWLNAMSDRLLDHRIGLCARQDLRRQGGMNGSIVS